MSRTLAAIAGIILAAFGMAGPAAAAPDFQLTVSPKSVFLAPGGTVNLTVGATGIDGFASPLTLTAMGLPTGVTAAFSPNPLSLPGTSTLTLTAGAGLVATEFNVNIAATGGGITHFALNGVNVVDFDLKPLVVEPPPCQGAIQGRLTNSETTAPIANRSFRVGFFRGTTDANGNYGPFSWFPGDYQFYADEVNGYWPKRQPVSIVCNQTTQLDYALLPWHPATIYGKVVEGNPSPTDSTVVMPTTTPIQGIEIRPEGSLPIDGAPSAADGSYITTVAHLEENNTAATNVRIFPFRPDLKGYWPRSSNTPSPIPIGDLAPFENKRADVALVRQCTGKISGIVTYGDTGLPAVGVIVRSSHAHADHVVVTSASGAYTIDKALLGYNNIPVDHTLSAHAPPEHPRGYYYYTSDPAKTHFDGCGAQRVVNLVLPPIPMGHIEGHVYDDNNVLVAGASIGIDAFGCRPCLHTEARSDANGYYRISDIPAPSQWPIRYFDQFRTPFWDSQSIVVNVTAGQTTVRDIHILRKRFASVSGTVRNAITGAAIPAVDIAETGALESPPFTSSAGDGSYLLGPIGLTGPDNSSRATTIDYSADGYWQHEEALTVEKDKAPYIRNVDLIPVCRGVVVTGVVRHAVTGAPIPFARVDTDQGHVVTADENGAYRLENLDVGSNNSPTELVITAQARDFEPQTKAIEIFCGAKVAVGSPGTIVIEKVTEPAGDPTEFDFDGALGKFALADGETHRAPALFPGTYGVTETPVAGWQLREVSCNDEPTEPGEDGLVSIDVGPGETVHCIFTNARPGTIVIKKETHPDGDPTAFEFFGPEEDSFTLGDGQSHTITGLIPGTHVVSEDVIDPWEVEGVTCDDDDSGTDPEGFPGELKVELAAGETVICTYTNRRVPTGTIIIKKETDPDGQLATFEFFGPEEDFSLADGEAHDITDLRAGTYYVSEAVADGWAIDRVECDDDDSGADPEALESATIELAGEETVTCTFFNKKLAPETGTIVVEKTTDPADDPTEFSFSSQELGEFALTGGGSQSFTDLTPGVYGLSEAALEGWALSSATCGDGSTVDSVDLAAGETVTCTFHNVRDAATGTIIIAKTTDPAGSPVSFEFDGELGEFSLADGDTHEAAGLAADSYSVTESTPPGWDLASATCTDGSEVDAISLSAGETVTCTFHNVQRGELQIRKVGVGGSGVFDFTTLSAGALGVDDLATGSTSVAQLVAPGDYVFTETAVDGWDVTGVACDDGRSARPSSGNTTQRTAAFAVEAGESVTCTFTNTRRGTITVTKETSPVSDPQDFAFSTTGGGLSAFSLDTDVGDTALPASRSSVLVPGLYSVRETLPLLGWDFTSVACISSSGASTVPSPSTSSAAVNVTLAAGDLVTCTYRNTKRARFAVVKTVAGQPPSGSQAFDFEVRTGASPSSIGTVIGSGKATAGNGGLVTIGSTNPVGPLLVAPGTYQFCEFILPGWGNPLGSTSFVPGLALDSIIDNAFQCIDVTVGPGAIHTLTLDNRPPPGGQAKTIGFWRNWASCSTSKGKQKPVLDDTLARISGGIPVGRLSVSTCPVAVDLLNKSTVADPSKAGDGKKMASDPAFNFAAQYVAFRLNIAAGARSGCEPANTASATGQAILLAIAFDGQTHARITKSDADRLNAGATILDQYNNNTLTC